MPQAVIDRHGVWQGKQEHRRHARDARDEEKGMHCDTPARHGRHGPYRTRGDAATIGSIRSSASPSAGTLAAAGILAVSAIARLLVARHELWLDEILSLGLARSLQSPLGVFILQNDNNHYLNTLWLWCAGPGRSALLYRLPAILTGTGATVLLWLRAPRDTAFGKTASAIIIGLSSLLITLTSDARGYAPMLFFALLSWTCIERFHQSKKTADAALFVLTASAAFLCQLIYLEVYLLLLAWSVWRSHRGHEAREFLLLHTGPLVLLTALYAFDIRAMQSYGNPGPGQFWEFLGLGSMVFGLRADTVPGALSFLLLACVLTAAYRNEIRSLFRLRWMRAAVGVALIPALLSLYLPSVIVTRHLMAFFALLLLLVTHALTRLWAREAAGKSLAAAFLITCLAGNLTALTKHIRYGWGSYTPAINYILTHDRSPEITVGSNQAFRASILLGHYAPAMEEGSRLRFAAKTDDPVPPWLLIEKPELHLTMPARTITRGGAMYRLAEETYKKGTYWVVYQKEFN